MSLPTSLASYIKLVNDDGHGEGTKETWCYLLKDTILLNHGTEFAWAITTIVFRFILVKYADRGLVSGGVVSKLFVNLYACFGLCLTFLMYLLGLTSNTRGDLVFINVCLQNNPDDYEKNWKNPLIGVCMTSVGIVTLWILYLRSRNYVVSRSKDGKTPPSIIGRYQRNILTLRESMWYHSLMYLSGLTFTVIYNFIYASNVSISISIIFISMPILFHIYILTKLQLRQIFQQSKNIQNPRYFYVREPKILPRRDFAVAKVPDAAERMIKIHVKPVPDNIIHVRPINV